MHPEVIPQTMLADADETVRRQHEDRSVQGRGKRHVTVAYPRGEEEWAYSQHTQHGDQGFTRRRQPKDPLQRQHAEKHREAEEIRIMRQRQELKLEESRIIRQRQELTAMSEMSRIMRQRQERNAMLEESRIMRQRQELNAMLEEQKRRLEEQRRIGRETQRLQEERTRADLRLSLPGVCRHYNSRQGCKDSECRGLHICRQFLADICNYGSACRYSHSLTTVHNQVICNSYQVDTSRELVLLQQLRRAFEESDGHKDGMFINNLTMCYRFRSNNPCEAPQCNRIHICRQFVVGACERNPNNCRNGHDLHTAHNQEVLRRHRLMKMTDTEILNILREKEETRMAAQASRNAAAAGSTMSGAVSAGPDRRGAVPRSRPSGQRGGSLHPRQPNQPLKPRDGLSDELQCPICLEMFNKATTLGCGHTFCSACLQDVKDGSGDRCPICRANITSTIRSVTLDNVIRSVTVQQ